MKAAVYYETGAPEVLRYEDVARPGRPRLRARRGRGDQHRGRRHAEPRRRRHGVDARTSSATSAPARSGGRRRRHRPSESANAWCARWSHGSHAELVAVPAARDVAGPRRADIERPRACPIAVRHRRRLPVRVRSPAGRARRCWSRRARAASASPRSSSPSGPARPCSPPRRATTSSPASRRSASTTASTTRDDDLADEVRRLTGGRGVDLVVDSVGGRPSPAASACLAYRGRIITRRQRRPRSAAARRRRRSWAATSRSPACSSAPRCVIGPRAHAMIGRHIDVVAAGELQVVVDRTVPARRGGRGPRLPRGPPGLRPGRAHPLTRLGPITVG